MAAASSSSTSPPDYSNELWHPHTRRRMPHVNPLRYKKDLPSPFLKQSVDNHVESFNLFLDEILPILPQFIEPVEVCKEDDKGQSMKIGIRRIEIRKPYKLDGKGTSSAEGALLPAHCREGHFTYGGMITAFLYSEGASNEEVPVELGEVPIMVGSKKCHLHGRDGPGLVKQHEDEIERGGYFIMNGNERIIRMLLMQKANHVLVIERGGFQNRGPLYTTLGTQIRCTVLDRLIKNA